MLQYKEHFQLQDQLLEVYVFYYLLEFEWQNIATYQGQLILILEDVLDVIRLKHELLFF